MIHTWANIALIFLTLLSLVAWAIPLVLLLLSVREMRKARHRVRSFMPKAQAHARQAASLVEGGSRKIARSIVRAHVWAARVQATVRALRGRPADLSSPASGCNEVNS